MPWSKKESRLITAAAPKLIMDALEDDEMWRPFRFLFSRSDALHENAWEEFTAQVLVNLKAEVARYSCPITEWAAGLVDRLCSDGELKLVRPGNGISIPDAKAMVLTVLTKKMHAHSCAGDCTTDIIHLPFVRARANKHEAYTWVLIGSLDYDWRIFPAPDNSFVVNALASYTMDAIGVNGISAGRGAYLWVRPSKYPEDAAYMLQTLRFGDETCSVREGFICGSVVNFALNWRQARLASMPDCPFKRYLRSLIAAAAIAGDISQFMECGASGHQARWQAPLQESGEVLLHPCIVCYHRLDGGLDDTLHDASHMAQQIGLRYFTYRTDPEASVAPFHAWAVYDTHGSLFVRASEFSGFNAFANQTVVPIGWTEAPVTWVSAYHDRLNNGNCALMSDFCDRYKKRVDGKLPALDSIIVCGLGKYMLCSWALTAPGPSQRLSEMPPEIPVCSCVAWVPMHELKAEWSEKWRTSIRPASVRLPTVVLIAAVRALPGFREYAKTGSILTAIQSRSLPTRLTITCEWTLRTYCGAFLAATASPIPTSVAGQWEDMACPAKWTVHRGVDNFSRMLRDASNATSREQAIKKHQERRLAALSEAAAAGNELRESDDFETHLLLYDRMVQRVAERTVKAAIANLPVWQEARNRMARIQALQKPWRAESAAERAERQRWLREEAAADKQVKEAFNQLGRECDKVQADMAAARRLRHKATLRKARLERRAVRLVEAAEEQRIERKRNAMRAWHKAQEKAVRRRRQANKARAAAERAEAEESDRAARRAQKNAIRLQRRAFRRLERGEPAEPPASDDGDDGDELPPLPPHLCIPPPQEPEPEQELKAPPSPATSTAPPSYPSTAVREQECDICFEEGKVWGRIEPCGHMFCMECGKKLLACPKCNKVITGPPLVCFF